MVRGECYLGESEEGGGKWEGLEMRVEEEGEEEGQEESQEGCQW